MSLLMMPREIGLKRARCTDVTDYHRYIKALNGKSNLYTSLYSFRDKDRDQPWRFSHASAVIDRAWWDFDAGERGTIDEVKDDVGQLLGRLDGDIRVVATGRGFHVHQLFSRSVVGRDFHAPLGRYQRLMAQGLKTLDGVGFPAKMTRIPDTYNVTRKRWAVNVPVDALRNDIHAFRIPDTPRAEWAVYDPFTGAKSASSFDFVKWVADNPAPEVKMQKFQGDVSSIGDIPIPPCLDKAVRVDNPGHEVRVALVQHLAEEMRWFADPMTVPAEQKREMEDGIFDFISDLGWEGFKPHLTRQGIRTNLNYKQSPSCKWYVARGMCVGKCWRYDGSF